MTVAELFAFALLAGVLSFSSPCCLPLMPGYIAFISSVGEQQTPVDKPTRRRAVLAALLFVVGFALVFTALGASAAFFGGFLVRHRDGLIRIGGVFVIVFGLATMGVFRVGWLMQERRFPLHRMRSGPAGALPLGMAFAIGWTPCIGPILATILTVASAAGSALWGASLLLVYSFGLGIPFILLAFGMSGTNRVAGWLRRHGRGVEIAGGTLLVFMGVMMITGYWLRLFIPVIRAFSRLGWPPI